MMFSEDRLVDENKHQYAIGGSLAAGVGARAGPYLVYRFKNVRTYHEVITEDFVNRPGHFMTEAEFKKQPAYDIAIGFYCKHPNFPVVITCEWIYSRIWNTNRTSIALGAGFSICIGSIKSNISK